MKLIRIFLIITILSFGCETFAQLNTIGVPYTRKLNINSNGGGAQTFDAASDKNGVMYLANVNGLLVYDGTNWNTIKSSNKSSVQSLCIDDETGTVYVGAKNEFGYLSCTANGQYRYQSLINKIPESNSTFNAVGKIVSSKKEGVVFQTTNYLFVLKDDTINVISGQVQNTGFNSIFKTDDRIFAVHVLNGIKELVDGKFVDMPGTEAAGNQIEYLEYDGNGFTIIGAKGIFRFNGSECTKVDSEINQYGIDKVLKTHAGNYVFAVRDIGLLITDSDFRIIKTIELKKIIQKLFEDRNNLLWLCAKDDVYILDVYTPYTVFTDSITGIQGSIKSMLQVGDNLYLGAEAVYHTNISTLEPKEFTELRSDKGLTGMWSMDTINGQIIGGSNKGLFMIDSLNNFINIDKKDELRNIRKFRMPANNSNVIIGIGGQGISTYQRKGDRWEYRVGADPGPDNFQAYSRHMEMDEDGYIWVSDRSYGVFRLRFNATYDTVLSAEQFNSENGLPSDLDNYVFRADKGVVIATCDGIYKYSKDSCKMVEDTRLNKLFGGKKAFELMYNDHNGSIWVKHAVKKKKGDDEETEWLLEQYVIESDSSAKCISSQYQMYKNSIYSFGYIGDGKYIIGSNDRFILYDSKVSKDFMAPYKASIRKMENIDIDTVIFGGNLKDNIQPEIVLSYQHHNIRIIFGAAFYEHPEETKFNTYLENNDKDWSGFRSDNYKEYANLSPGTYTMHVIARNYYGVDSEEATITFRILPPWYLTNWAIAMYFVLLGLIIWLIVKMYTRKLVRDKQKLEQIVEERTAEIRDQNKLIMAQNKSITDSINYAKHIQTAMLPLDEKIAAALPEHFILFRPKDIVSGDYYWYAETDKYIIITAADCTGHGVPGAFMSMIGSQILTEIVGEGITSPDEILTNQNRRIRKALKQDTTENHDGMDMALCTINKETHLVEFAGAKNQLVVIKNGELTEYKADKQGIGGTQLYGDDFQYQKTAIEPDGNTWFYMFSDGYKDQFGGPSNGKFLIKRLRQLLMDIHEKSPEEQREILNTTIQDWIDQGKGEQTDDIILMGFRL